MVGFSQKSFDFFVKIWCKKREDAEDAEDARGRVGCEDAGDAICRFWKSGAKPLLLNNFLF